MARGNLRIYLGAAPGVGKTYALLDEGWRRRQRGTDVVVGFVETHGRPNTIAQVRDLEVVPRRSLVHRGSAFEEMDVDAVMARRPDVVLVDELAHTNVPGSRNEKRWQDVDELLDAGIDVISTVNIQHLESVNDVVEEITGVKQRETIPDEIVRRADQIELVDMTPEALRRRMAHGNIYGPEKIDAALGNYFRVGNLAALREIALLWVADRVDEALEAYREAQGISTRWETRERVVVAVTGAPSGEQLIRRAARMAQRSHGELIGVHIRADDGLAAPPGELLERHRQLLADLGGEYHEVVGSDVAKALTGFARGENATQLVLGASRRSRWRELLQGSVINTVVREAEGVDVHVIGYESEAGADRLFRMHRRPATLPARRRVLGWLLAGFGIPLLVVALVPLRSDLDLATVELGFLLLVVAIAAVGGRLPAFTAAAVASLAVNWFFTPPFHTFTVAEPENAVSLAVFLVVALVVGQLVSVAVRRSVEAQRARSEAEALARVAGGLVGEADPLDLLLTHLRTTFGLDAVAVLREHEGGGWRLEAESGADPPASPEGRDAFPLVDGSVLVLEGPPLPADDRRVLQAFVGRLDAALERRRLLADASDAAALAEADRFRTAILRAVSHDLRTPLASIKAAASSLLQQDVEWSPEARDDFVATIESEADRLNLLVGNLLDMSRLEAGVVSVQPQPVGLEEVVAPALAPLEGAALAAPVALVVDVPETLPEVLADPALLERALANVVANAIRHAPPGSTVRVEAGRVGSRVDVRVVDEGPGVAAADRDRVFEPFQRLGDRGEDGVGLGLAVARGFVQAMGGELTLDDTPGGGLTVVLSLPSATVAEPIGASSVAPGPVVS